MRCFLVKKGAAFFFIPSRAQKREVRTFYPRSAHFSTERCAPLGFELVTRGFGVDLGYSKNRAF